MVWNWVSIAMQDWKNWKAIKNGDVTCDYFALPRLLAYCLDTRTILLSCRKAIRSQCDAALLQSRSFKKWDIFKWCSIIAGPRLTPTGTPHSDETLYCQHASVLTSLGRKKDLVSCWSNAISGRQHNTPAHG